MAITTLTIQQNVLRELKLDPTSSVLQARALRWINKTLDKFQMKFPWAEFLQTSEMTLTLVVDQPTYALPSDMFDLVQVRNDDESVILRMLPREEFDREHPDPSDEETATPHDGTLEFDKDNRRHILRVAPIPDAADTFYAIMRRWHPSLSSSQNIQYDKLETALEDGAVYHGSLSVYSDNEYAQYRMELKAQWLESEAVFSQVLAMQRPKEPQIPTILKRGDYFNATSDSSRRY